MVGFAQGLNVRILGIPETGARSRVETQTKLDIQLVTDDGEKVTAWSHLVLPRNLVTKSGGNNTEILPEKALCVEPFVVCANNPEVPVQMCDSCVRRERHQEARRLQLQAERRAKGARSGNTKDEGDSSKDTTEEDSNMTGENGRKRIMVFHCKSAIDFSKGECKLPTRITCYCRHHDESEGFLLCLSLKDHKGRVIATGVSPPLMITDDHKSVRARALKEGKLTGKELKRRANKQTNANGESQTATSNGSESTSQTSNSREAARAERKASVAAKSARMKAANAMASQAARNTSSSVMAQLQKTEAFEFKFNGTGSNSQSQIMNGMPSLLGATVKNEHATMGSYHSPNATQSIDEMFDMAVDRCSTDEDDHYDSVLNGSNGQKQKDLDDILGDAKIGSPLSKHSIHDANLGGVRKSEDGMHLDSDFRDLHDLISGVHAPSKHNDVVPSLHDEDEQNALSLGSPTMTHYNSPLSFASLQPNTGSAPSADHSFGHMANQPRIDKLIPAEGPCHGGIECTILGSNFRNGLQACFGDIEATATHFWGPSTMLVVVPPSVVPGPVLVSLRDPTTGKTTGNMLVESHKESIPVTFMYKDDSDRNLMECALQIVGLKLTGRLDDARAIALRIMSEQNKGGSGGSSGSGAGTAGQATEGILETSLAKYAPELEDLARTICSQREATSEEGSDGEKATESLLYGPLRFALGPETGRDSGINLSEMVTAEKHTVLHLAAFEGYADIVDLVLDYMDSRNDSRHRSEQLINQPDINGYTALHFAVMRNHVEVVRLLLHAGARTQLMTKNGYLPRDLATPAVGEILNDLISRYHISDEDSEEDEDEDEEVGGNSSVATTAMDRAMHQSPPVDNAEPSFSDNYELKKQPRRRKRDQLLWNFWLPVLVITLFALTYSQFSSVVPEWTPSTARVMAM
eukprot:Clim_evm62s232 gene=Clim_evmTU62s232